MLRIIRATVVLSLVLGALVASGTHSGASNPAKSGLVLIGEGAAATYSASYDNGGWDRIVARHLAWGHAGPDFVYRDDGQWCVHPDYTIGNVLTLRNARTGATLTCTIGDAVAPQDQAHWRANVVIEVSHVTFVRLGLDDGNAAEVWVLP